MELAAALERRRRPVSKAGGFPGGCGIDAAAVVGGDPNDVFDRLSSLVDKSLLVATEGPDTEPRYRFLETVREFGFEQLRASSEGAIAGDAQARYFVALIEAGEPEVSKRQMARAHVEHANVRAAARWFLDHGDVDQASRLALWLGYFWWMRSLFGEARTLGGCVASSAKPAPLASKSLWRPTIGHG